MDCCVGVLCSIADFAHLSHGFHSVSLLSFSSLTLQDDTVEFSFVVFSRGLVWLKGFLVGLGVRCPCCCSKEIGG